MLTTTKISNTVRSWAKANDINVSDAQVNKLIEKLIDGVYEIAQQSHQKGLEGKAL